MIDPGATDFADTPARPDRAAFGYVPEDPLQAPAVSIVTPFFRPGAVFRETARCVMRQSFQQWEWIVVNDASTDADSLEALAELRGSDPRVRVIDQQHNAGPSTARNRGIRTARAAFVYLLDDDDLIEPTAIEKLFWFLHSHPDAAFANSWSVGFGAKRYLWTRGFEQGATFRHENFVGGRVMLRRSAFDRAGGFDETLREGFEDWDFWLRCAAQGLWGGTVPEFLEWYRRRTHHGDRWQLFSEPRRLDEFRAELERRYPGLYRGPFPELRPPAWLPFAGVEDVLPCQNRLARVRPRILMLLPWLALGGSDKFNLDVVRGLVQRGFEVSIATTLPGEHAWGPEFLRLTPDVHVLDRFLPPADQPRYLRYLIGSRRPDVVLVSHSELGYLLLPYLRAHCPEPVYLDYCHIEQEEWKNGGYPRHSVGMQQCLDLQLVSSRHLRDWMVAREADPERIEVVYTNVDADEWKPSPDARKRLREEWAVADGTTVILFAGRLCEQKQPRVLARVVLELARERTDFLAVVAGEGEERPWLEDFVRRHGLENRLLLLGALSSPQVRDAMSASDVFFLPSRWEGIALSLFEAMAMELAVVAADVGGQAELVTPDSGILVPRADEEGRVQAYRDALVALLDDPELREELGHRARDRVSKEFPLEGMLTRLVGGFERARGRRRPAGALSLELAREWATQAVEFLRLERFADGLWAERMGREAPGHLSALLADQELAGIERSRSWRAVRRLQGSWIGQLLARLDPRGGWRPRESGDARERLRGIHESRPWALIQALKGRWLYRLYAGRRYGPGWDANPASRDRG